MERMNWGSTFAVHQAFEAQAGDKIKLEWSGGTLGFMTIMAKADFDAGRYRGPYPIASDVSWAVWQVLQSGTTVVFAVVEPPGENIQVAATLEKVPLPAIPGNLSHGDLEANQGKALVNEAFALTNERRVNISSREPRPAGAPEDPGSVPALILDERLSVAAQTHAMNMAELDFFAHRGQDGSSPSARAAAAGWPWGAGENISAGHATAAGAIKSWMQSSGHRWNMLRAEYTHIGLGV
ncbi:CAP domain-containing protein, partial [Candidatus Electronema sp. TJ]|uniref:CAP domain-containing protein n=1 Tax=Candidatus Electronema sp. TJ TaxID=3401573 RepID=UPI003AA7D390